MKRIALYLDGTWSVPASRTNVYELFSRTARTGTDGVRQKVMYRTGIGTDEVTRVTGGLLGLGLSQKVYDAYQSLMDTYEDGDEVYLFGFSRGAYTARSLAGLIARYGLLRPEGPLTVDDVWALYQRRDGARSLDATPAGSTRRGRRVNAEADRLRLWSRPVDIRFIGVWDTVGALGVPFGRIRGLSRSTTLFHNTRPSRRYRGMYQAVAVDEHRPAFRPALWTAYTPDVNRPVPGPGQAVEQRWFVGAHADVGGGLELSRRDPDPDGDGRANPLPRIPARWLQEKAVECGLTFVAPVDLDGSECRGPVCDSFGEFLDGWYRRARLGRRYHRPIGAGPRRTVTRPGWSWTVNETVDGSVFERWRQDDSYRPPNLLAWAARTGADPATTVGAVAADSGAPVDEPVRDPLADPLPGPVGGAGAGRRRAAG